MTQRKKTLTVTFLELPPTVDGRLSGPLSRDVYSLYRLPSRACDLLAAIARSAGFEDTAVLTPAMNNNGRLSSADWRRLGESDVIGISIITRTAPPSYEAAKRIRDINPRAKIVFGGPHGSALPEEALRYGDVVVLNEGDHTLVELLERFAESLDAPALSDVRGIAFREDLSNRRGPVTVNPARPFLKRSELNALPFPVFSPSVLKRITHQTICTSRGCPHGCEYCSVIQNFGRGYRCLSVERTVELIQHHLTQSRASIFFSDDNFTANRKRTKSILEQCLSRDIKLPSWSCQSRVEAAFDEELLDLMVRTGIDTVQVGFESVVDETLALWNKASSVEKNREAIERFRAKGIAIHGMFVLGSDVDTPQTVDRTVVFAKEMRLDTAQFFAITPIPGPPLTQKLKTEGRVLTQDWHLYDGQNVVVRPRKMKPAELQDGIARAFREFYSPKEGLRMLFSKGPRRFRNCMIRFLGRRLFRRIVKETLPHQRALERLNDWLGRVDEICSRVHDRLRDFSGRIDAGRPLADMLEENLQILKSGMEALAERYHPFCRRVLKELRVAFHSEAEAALAIA